MVDELTAEVMAMFGRERPRCLACDRPVRPDTVGAGHLHPARTPEGLPAALCCLHAFVAGRLGWEVA